MPRTDPHLGQAWTPTAADVSCIIAMAWQDDTAFEAIALQFGLSESEVLALMRAHLKPRAFTVWRMRTRGRSAKHEALQKHRHACEQPASQRLSPTDGPQEYPLPPMAITRASLR